MLFSSLPSVSQRVVDILHVRSCREHGRCCLWLLWAPSAASKVLWETRFVRRSSRAKGIARVFHSTGRIHRLHEPVGSVARVADVIVGVRRGVVVVGPVVMSSSSGGCVARRAFVASSGP